MSLFAIVVKKPLKMGDVNSQIQHNNVYESKVKQYKATLEGNISKFIRRKRDDNLAKWDMEMFN